MLRWWRLRRARRRVELAREQNRLWHTEQDQAYREAVQRLLADPDPAWNSPTALYAQPMTRGQEHRANGGRRSPR